MRERRRCADPAPSTDLRNRVAGGGLLGFDLRIPPVGDHDPGQASSGPASRSGDYKVSKAYGRTHQQSFPLPRRFHQDDGFTPNNQDPFTVGRRSLSYC